MGAGPGGGGGWLVVVKSQEGRTAPINLTASHLLLTFFRAQSTQAVRWNVQQHRDKLQLRTMPAVPILVRGRRHAC